MVKAEKRRSATWPLRAAAMGVALLLFLFVLPMLLLPGEGQGKHVPEEVSPLPMATLPLAAPAGAVPVEGWDGRQSLRFLKSDGTVEELKLQDYLWGVTAAEMPASFELEALKAQTVAARTYCLYQRNGEGEKHPGRTCAGTISAARPI